MTPIAAMAVPAHGFLACRDAERLRALAVAALAGGTTVDDTERRAAARDTVVAAIGAAAEAAKAAEVLHDAATAVAVDEILSGVGTRAKTAALIGAGRCCCD
mmetsp:Transcript_22235/g.63630  ORF Transcript_22235/g.63630 Transcript_22235/m.63630 type:complete len:102 (+) Transcript_22235:908-1213(+)